MCLNYILIMSVTWSTYSCSLYFQLVNFIKVICCVIIYFFIIWRFEYVILVPQTIQCNIPRCDPGCYVTFETKPCPSCKCDNSKCIWYLCKYIYLCFIKIITFPKGQKTGNKLCAIFITKNCKVNLFFETVNIVVKGRIILTKVHAY